MTNRSCLCFLFTASAMLASCSGSSGDPSLFGTGAPATGGASTGGTGATGGTFGAAGFGVGGTLGAAGFGGGGAAGSVSLGGAGPIGAGGASAGTNGVGPGGSQTAGPGGAGIGGSGGAPQGPGGAPQGPGGAPEGPGGAPQGPGGAPEGPGGAPVGAGGDASVGGAGVGGSDMLGGGGDSSGGTGGSGVAGSPSGTVEMIAGGLAIPSRITQDDQSLYVTVRGSLTANTNSGSVIRIGKSDLAIQPLATDVDIPVAITLGPPGVVFASSITGHVYGVGTDGTNLHDYGAVFTTTSAVADMLMATSPSELITLGVAGAVSHWDFVSAPVTIAELPGIGRMALSGSTLVVAAETSSLTNSEVDSISLAGTETQLITGLNGAVGVAVSGTTAYATEPEGGNVWMVPVDGGFPGQTLADTESFPWAVATDSTDVYWVDRGNGDVATCVAGTVVRAPLGGTGTKQTLAPVQCPIALAVDDLYVYVVGTGDSGATNGAVYRVTK